MILTLFRGFFPGAQNYFIPSSRNDDQSMPIPGSTIYYDKDLIGKLESDHVEMKTLLSRIVLDEEKGKISSARSKILKLNEKFKKHSVLEHIRLYVYLNKITENDKMSHEIVTDFRFDMAEINKAVSSLVVASNSMNERNLRKEINKFGKVLLDRIDREETILYPIYMPV
jgi:hypothetical protein